MAILKKKKDCDAIFFHFKKMLDEKWMYEDVCELEEYGVFILDIFNNHLDWSFEAEELSADDAVKLSYVRQRVEEAIYNLNQAQLNIL